MTLLFPLLMFHIWDKDCSHLKRGKKREGEQASIFLSLTHLLPFHSPFKSSALSHFWSDFLRQLNYVGPGPFVFQQNIREWSLWVIRNIFQLDPISHLVSWRLLAKKNNKKNVLFVQHLSEERKQSNTCLYKAGYTHKSAQHRPHTLLHTLRACMFSDIPINPHWPQWTQQN